LVVEDDEQDQALLVRMLTEAGFEVETATTGAQAIARARDEAYTAITLDLLLPDMTGLEILSAIRSGGPNRDVPVVVVTVIAERASVIGFAVSDILAKPVNKDALLTALRRVDTNDEQPANVLVVNDDASLAKRMGETLEQIGYHAVCMRDGTSALDEVARTRPRAIILDLHTPDSIDFLDRLRQLPDSKNTPVLLWTDKDLDAEDYARLTGAARSAVHQGSGDTATLVQDLRAMLSTH
jgi:DNA-binding response OmpR family regulator